MRAFRLLSLKFGLMLGYVAQRNDYCNSFLINQHWKEFTDFQLHFILKYIEIYMLKYIHNLMCCKLQCCKVNLAKRKLVLQNRVKLHF